MGRTYIHGDRFRSSGKHSDADPSARYCPGDIAAGDDDDKAYHVDGECDAESWPCVVGVVRGRVGGVMV